MRFEWHAILDPFHMYYIYLIQSQKYPKQVYTGFTENVEERIKDHNAGKSAHTEKYKPWKLIFYCAFLNKNKALDFEKYLKTASGIAFRNKRFISFVLPDYSINPNFSN